MKLPDNFIDDELVLFKDFTMLEIKTMFYNLPTGASGGGDLPRGYVALQGAMRLHRHYTSLKLSNSPVLKPRITSEQYQQLPETSKAKYGRFCGHNEVYYTILP